MHLSWHELHKFVQNLMMHASPAWPENARKGVLSKLEETRPFVLKCDLLYNGKNKINITNLITINKCQDSVELFFNVQN